MLGFEFDCLENRILILRRDRRPDSMCLINSQCTCLMRYDAKHRRMRGGMKNIAGTAANRGTCDAVARLEMQQEFSRIPGQKESLRPPAHSSRSISLQTDTMLKSAFGEGFFTSSSSSASNISSVSNFILSSSVLFTDRNKNIISHLILTCV